MRGRSICGLRFRIDSNLFLCAMQLILKFPRVFWDKDEDMWGHLSDDRDKRGESYLFWNIARVNGEPVLVALQAGMLFRVFACAD